MGRFGVGARMRALREMSGYRNMDALAVAIKANGSRRGLGETVLRQIEREERPVEARELQDIADACHVPLAWFTADFDRLEEVSEPPRAVIAREMKAAAERSRKRQKDRPEDQQPRSPEGVES